MRRFLAVWIAIPSIAVAADFPIPATISDIATRFEEIPGEQLFSGRVIVRPMPAVTLRAAGWNERDIAASRACDIPGSVPLDFPYDRLLQLRLPRRHLQHPAA